MIRKIRRAIERWLLWHWRWYSHAKLYVVADATDNSVTFSEALFRLLDVIDQDVEPKVMVFMLLNALKEWNGKPLYAFAVNPPINEETHLADIQYNQKHHCVGFECLVPTVNRIFYDYGLKADTRVKLSVEPKKRPATGSVEMKYYVIMPPR